MRSARPPLPRAASFEPGIHLGIHPGVRFRSRRETRTLDLTIMSREDLVLFDLLLV